MCRHRQRGQALLLVALGIVVFLGFLAFVIDFGAMYMSKQKLRNHGDATSLAGALLLPNATAAKSTAADYYARNLGLTSANVITQGGCGGNCTRYLIGNDTVDVTTPYQDSATQAKGIAPANAIKVLACRTVGHHIGGLFGIQPTRLCARAVAIKTSGGVNQAIFANREINISGNNNVINGHTHSNDEFEVSGNNNTITGTAFYVNAAIITGHNNSITPLQTTPKPIPPVPNTLAYYRSLAQANGTYFTSTQTFSANNTTLSGVIFVDGGDLRITGNNISGTVTFISNGGAITFEGNSLDLTAAVDRLLAYVPTGGNIKFATPGSSTNNVFRGTIYATGGNIEVDSNNFDLRGALIAGGNVELQKNNAIITHDGAFTFPDASGLFE